MADVDELDPDPPLTPDEETRVGCLSTVDVTRIDETLLSHVSRHWRKVAMVVARSLDDPRVVAAAVPYLYYARRIRHLVDIGVLEAQGDLSRMRFSEVRLRASHAGGT